MNTVNLGFLLFSIQLIPVTQLSINLSHLQIKNSLGINRFPMFECLNVFINFLQISFSFSIVFIFQNTQGSSYIFVFLVCVCSVCFFFLKVKCCLQAKSICEKNYRKITKKKAFIWLCDILTYPSWTKLYHVWLMPLHPATCLLPTRHWQAVVK